MYVGKIDTVTSTSTRIKPLVPGQSQIILVLVTGSEENYVGE
jgi:hypothetical protein